jgi:hypothetical protein
MKSLVSVINSKKTWQLLYLTHAHNIVCCNLVWHVKYCSLWPVSCDFCDYTLPIWPVKIPFLLLLYSLSVWYYWGTDFAHDKMDVWFISLTVDYVNIWKYGYLSYSLSVCLIQSHCIFSSVLLNGRKPSVHSI